MTRILVFTASAFQQLCCLFGLDLPATLPALFRNGADERRTFENSATGHSDKEVFHFSTAAVRL